MNSKKISTNRRNKVCNRSNCRKSININYISTGRISDVGRCQFPKSPQRRLDESEEGFCCRGGGNFLQESQTPFPSFPGCEICAKFA